MASEMITAIVTVTPKLAERIHPLHTITLKLASINLDPNGEVKDMIEGTVVRKDAIEGDVSYEGQFEVANDFGEIGAVIVEIDENSTEKFIHNISLHYQNQSAVINFSCNSWVQPRNLIPDRRIFFSTKSYLPGETPAGMVKLREEDLVNLRGERNGEEDMNERKAFERIYSYDVYNDLGDSEKHPSLKRPVLGGPTHPYPRRCRTGRPHSQLDPLSETRVEGKDFYVPRDEEFSEIKQELFKTTPSSSQPLSQIPNKPFIDFTEIDLLFRDGIEISPAARKHSLGYCLNATTASLDSQPEPDSTPANVVKFPPPEALSRDKFNWLSDHEFARQTLAGLNPYSLQLVKSWPIEGSAMTTELIQNEIGTTIKVEEAVEQKKLFILDYHKVFFDFVEAVRGLKGTTLYGSRTLFFLNSDDTLRPLAIELTRPPIATNPENWTQVFTPNKNATNIWLWRLAKAHVLAHDSGYHQLVSHWLRTHCAVEPYAIAAHRQLSTMHPIYRLLHPHFRYNLRINANARQVLVNAGGIIEGTFSTSKYSLEASSAVYDKEWQFNLQALPEDLIHRGMAERDETAEHGLRLTIKDYPFANDGLILWDALKQWVTAYVNHYYKEPCFITDDKELQKWWEEIRTIGHGDKKDKDWWPNLQTAEDLIEIVTSIAWVASGHHASVNFGQYAHAAYFPNRPSIARTKMPTEDSDQLPEDFMKKPENVLIQSFPSVLQAVTVARTMFVLSIHAPDEEYIGDNIEPSWVENPEIANAFSKFKVELEKLEKFIDDRNNDSSLKNRRGAGNVPYELFKPTSNNGVTGKGVPYSIST